MFSHLLTILYIITEPSHTNVRSANTAGTVNHTFSHYAQYSARESSLVPWTEHSILTIQITHRQKDTDE